MNVCYLGNSPPTHTRYREAFPESETVFLCSDYLELLRLRASVSHDSPTRCAITFESETLQMVRRWDKTFACGWKFFGQHLLDRIEKHVS